MIIIFFFLQSENKEKQLMAMKIILKSQNGNHSFPEIAKRRTPGLYPEKAPFVPADSSRLYSPPRFSKNYSISGLFFAKKSPGLAGSGVKSTQCI